jgi:hypothetical protein
MLLEIIEVLIGDVLILVAELSMLDFSQRQADFGLTRDKDMIITLTEVEDFVDIFKREDLVELLEALLFRMSDDELEAIENLFNIFERHIEEITDTTRETLEEPNMSDRRG